MTSGCDKWKGDRLFFAGALQQAVEGQFHIHLQPCPAMRHNYCNGPKWFAQGVIRHCRQGPVVWKKELIHTRIDTVQPPYTLFDESPPKMICGWVDPRSSVVCFPATYAPVTILAVDDDA
jgi:hypothetical protein